MKHNRESKTKSQNISFGTPLGVHDRDNNELHMGDIIEYVPYGWICQIEDHERKSYIAYTWRGDNLVIPKDEGKRMGIVLITGDEADRIRKYFQR